MSISKKLVISSFLATAIVLPISADISNADVKSIEYRTVTGNSVNFRTGPGTNYSSVGKLNKGYKVEYIGISGSWANIKYNGKVGYIHKDYISSSSGISDNNVKSTKIVTASSLNFRRGASTSASKIGSLPKGTEVGFISESNGWSKISYKGKVGYVSSSYLADKSSSNVSSYNKADKVIEFAKTLLGKPYVWGAEGPSSFDCSGYTQYVFKKSVGISLPRVSREQARFGKSVSRNNLQKGDLIALDMEGANNGQVNHIGIYMGDGKIIHASATKKKVLISNMTDYYYKSIVSIRRVL